MRGVRVERARDFGEAFLGLALWRCPGLHTLPGDLLEPGEEEVPWATVASVLTPLRPLRLCVRHKRWRLTPTTCGRAMSR